MSAMLTLMPRGVNFVLDGVERRLFQPPIRPRHLAQCNTRSCMAAALKPLLALSLIGWCAVCAPTYGAECRDETETVQGTLRLVRTRHAMNSTPIEALQLVFNPPLCITYKESVTAKEKQRLDGVTTVHLLVTAADAARLKRRAGAQVTA